MKNSSPMLLVAKCLASGGSRCIHGASASPCSRTDDTENAPCKNTPVPISFAKVSRNGSPPRCSLASGTPVDGFGSPNLPLKPPRLIIVSSRIGVQHTRSLTAYLDRRQVHVNLELLELVLGVFLAFACTLGLERRDGILDGLDPVLLDPLRSDR